MKSAVLQSAALGFPWQTLDPFLFCVHHKDAYPAGDERMAPRAELSGRNLGNDFSYKDGWSMYHGLETPGFPQHPHRGFETITIARKGFIDHSDSMGAAARFGRGDVQWMTAGRGIVHSEMFPLVNEAAPNPTELFQIWINLPARSKFAEPYFSMYWNENIPRLLHRDAEDRETEVTVYAGTLPGAAGVQPPPDSWAAQRESAVRILSVRMAPGARWTLPPAEAGVNRVLYYFQGDQLQVADHAAAQKSAMLLADTLPAELHAGEAECELLLLEGRPIGEPVVQYGPFVMNSEAEIQQTMDDFRRTRFGGWPWPDDAPVHARNETRFARHADGRVERPQQSVAIGAG